MNSPIIYFFDDRDLNKVSSFSRCINETFPKSLDGDLPHNLKPQECI